MEKVIYSLYFLKVHTCFTHTDSPLSGLFIHKVDNTTFVLLLFTQHLHQLISFRDQECQQNKSVSRLYCACVEGLHRTVQCCVLQSVELLIVSSVPCTIEQVSNRSPLGFYVCIVLNCVLYKKIYSQLYHLMSPGSRKVDISLMVLASLKQKIRNVSSCCKKWLLVIKQKLGAGLLPANLLHLSDLGIITTRQFQLTTHTPCHLT